MKTKLSYIFTKEIKFNKCRMCEKKITRAFGGRNKSGLCNKCYNEKQAYKKKYQIIKNKRDNNK